LWLRHGVVDIPERIREDLHVLSIIRDEEIALSDGVRFAYQENVI
jgi:hypothetical protein